MTVNTKRDTIKAANALVDRQGGSFFLNNSDKYVYDSLSSYVSGASSLRRGDALPLTFSIYNRYENKEDVSLSLLINPKDIQYGQTLVSSNAYTRESWVTSVWGNQMQTIQCSGTTAAFMVVADKELGIFESGLTTVNRVDSISFINLLSLIALYRNNGNYFMYGGVNKSLYSSYDHDSVGRVINVMDSILLSYDGVEYVGSFNAFTLSESAESPFSLEYNFEFVVSCLRGESMEGHLRMGGNEKRGDYDIPISLQGFGSSIDCLFSLDEPELNETFSKDNAVYEQARKEEIAAKQEAEGVKKTRKIEGFKKNGRGEVTPKKVAKKCPESTNSAEGQESTNSAEGQDSTNSAEGQESTNNTGDQEGGKAGSCGEKVTYRFGIKGNSNVASYAESVVVGAILGSDNEDLKKKTKIVPVRMGYITDFLMGGFVDNQKYATSASGNQEVSNLTVMGVAKKMAEAMDYDLDPSTIPTIIYNETGSMWSDENPPKKTTGDVNRGHSYGITQINTPTYHGLLEDETFIKGLESLGYDVDSVKKADTKALLNDPVLGILCSVAVLSRKQRSTKADNNNISLQLASYNAGQGVVSSKTIPLTTAAYVGKAAKFRNDPDWRDTFDVVYNNDKIN